MSGKALTTILALLITASAAPLVERVWADDGFGASCCVCFCGSQNSTTMGTGSSDFVCTDLDSASGAECNAICDPIGCQGKVSIVPCTDPGLAETCAVATMAPASSPVGLLALVAALSGFGAFYLRRRSLRR